MASVPTIGSASVLHRRLLKRVRLRDDVSSIVADTRYGQNITVVSILKGSCSLRPSFPHGNHHISPTFAFPHGCTSIFCPPRFHSHFLPALLLPPFPTSILDASLCIGPRGEQAATALEANLSNLESKLDAILAALEAKSDPQTTTAAAATAKIHDRAKILSQADGGSAVQDSAGQDKDKDEARDKEDVA
ncbi:hypothetical protein ACJZ2D_016007 [Fusarium nematophilum]